jgi:hypothetical protein
MSFGRGIRSVLLGYKKEGNRDEEGGRSEISALLAGLGGRPVGYGYRHGRSGDGASGSASSGHMTIVHREDCEGQCGMQPRRRSGD